MGGATGATDVVGVVAAGATVAAADVGALAWVVAVRVTVCVTAGAGFGAATFVECFTVRVVVDCVVPAVVVVVSVVAGVVSTEGAGAGATVGAGSVVVGWASWANSGVEERAKAAAIAEVAAMRACRVVVIIRNNRFAARVGAGLSAD
jgi:hypothetical protein